MQAMPERWTPETYNDFLAELKQEADEAYRLFNEKLLASELPTLGLRLPFLRKTAKAIAKGDPNGFLAVCGKTYHEERLLYGLVAAELPYADFLPHSDKMAKFLVENWAICDTFCSSLKKVLSHKADKAHYFRYISVYLSSLNPWASTGVAHRHAPPLSDSHHHQYSSDSYAGSGLRLLLCPHGAGMAAGRSMGEIPRRNKESCPCRQFRPLGIP